MQPEPGATNSVGSLPTQQQLLIPLLETLSDLGPAPPRMVYNALSERMEITADERERAIAPGSSCRAWDRTVRWTRQKATLLGYIAGEPFKNWELTGAGK